MTYDYLTGEQLRRDFGQATFFTATDGNHGRGVAWAARQLGQKAVVHMPKGSAKMRFDNIAREGAKVTIEDMNYDDCVRLAAAEAARTEHGVVMQDTAWEGYELIPSWIMQGYGSMAQEAVEQLRALEVNRPTHVFVQAGVGCMASAVVGYFANLFPESRPNSSSWRRKRRPACTRGPARGTAAPPSSAATCPPSWPGWPAASPTYSAGTYCATTPTPSWPARTGSARGACGCWPRR